MNQPENASEENWLPQPLERISALPLWQQTQKLIEREIRAGRLLPGARLPTEAVLAERLGVHRHTVRHAIENLRARGLLRAEQGRGTFVREATLRHGLSEQASLSATARLIGRQPRRVVISARRVRADYTKAAELRLDPGVPLQSVKTVSYVDEIPVSVTVSYFPLPRFKGIEHLIAEHASVGTALRMLGVPQFLHWETRVRAKLPTAEVAEMLRQPRARPVLATTNINVDEAGVPIQLSYGENAGNWVEFVVKYRFD